MRGPKLQVSLNPLAPMLSGFTHPGVPTGGAREFSPAKMLAYPLKRLEGAGVITGEPPAHDEGPQLRTVFAPFYAPVQGGGVIAGSAPASQGLVDPYDNSATFVSETGSNNGSGYE